MHQEQRQRTQTYLRERGITQALFSHIDTVKWLTGFNPPVEVGPSFFLGGPPLVWYSDGQFALIILENHRAAAAGLENDPDCEVISYQGYTIEAPNEGAAHLREVFTGVINQSGNLSANLGLETQWLPMFVWQALRETPSANPEFIAIDDWLAPLRAIKTAEEMEKLRRNFHLTDVAHQAAREAVRPGQREIDVYAHIASAIYQAAGQRVPIGNDFVVGYRQDNIAGGPLDYEIREGDSFIADISTIQDGYWSDSCATYYAGEPSQEQRTLHRIVSEALEIGLSMAKPGVVVRDIDQRLRQHIADAGYPVYPHHTGHGVGVTGHETPRIVPYNDEVLEAGMVIMIEPGIYLPGKTGVRLEDAVLITEDGAERLTHHDKHI